MAAAQPLDASTCDLDRAWNLPTGVALRPEKFGALAYDFRTRRLTMLKDPLLVAVIRSLAEQPTARAACAAAGVPDVRLGEFAHALGVLAGSGLLRERGAP